MADSEMPPRIDRSWRALVTTPVPPGCDHTHMKPITPSPERGDVLHTTIFPARRKPMSRDGLQRALSSHRGRVPAISRRFVYERQGRRRPQTPRAQ